MDKIDLRYQRGKIYTVRCYDDDSLIYVGSTIQPLSVRMAGHRCDNTCSLYHYVNNNFNGNWKNWYIELYEEYPCNKKTELNKREGEITRLIGNINKRIEGRTDKEDRNDNKEIIAEKAKQHYEANKEIILEKVKEYYQDHKEEKAQYDKQYRNANKEKITEQQKQYRNNNKEIISEKKKQKTVCNNCGCEVRKDGLKEHQKTNKCKNYNITKE